MLYILGKRKGDEEANFLELINVSGRVLRLLPLEQIDYNDNPNMQFKS